METFSFDRKVADLEIAMRRLGGDKALLAKMADFFLEDAPELMSQLVTAFHTGDYDLLTRHAHSLKGLSATFEAKTFQQLAAEIEISARSRDIEPLKSKIPQLEIAFDHLAMILKRIVQGADFSKADSNTPVS